MRPARDWDSAGPLRMSEDHAREFLTRWLSNDFYSYVPLPPDRDGLVHARVEVQYLRNYDDTLPETRTEALDVRRAMEAMNAIACCRGFSIDENEAFWRRLFVAQDDMEATVSNSPFYKFDACMLSRYRVTAFGTLDENATAVAIAACCSMAPGSDAMAIREEIHDCLALYLVGVPPQLEVDIDLFSQTVNEESESEYCQRVKRCLVVTGRIWIERSAYSERVAMVCDAYVDAGALLALSELATLAHVRLRKINLLVRAQESVSLASELVTFMQELARVDRTEALTLMFQFSDRLSFAAVFSAIPSMTLLQYFAVRAHDMKKVRNEIDSARSYYAWLAYALLACHRQQRELAVDFQLPKRATKWLDASLTTTQSLLREAMFRLDHRPTFLPHGSTATVRSSAYLTTTIAGKITLRESTVELVVAQDRQVDVVALCESTVIIVWLGVGLMCTDKSCLKDWETHPLAYASDARKEIVTDVTFLDAKPNIIATFLKNTGSKLHRLGVSTIQASDSEALRMIFSSCPRLETLSVESMESVAPILAAYENGTCSLSTLSTSTIVPRAFRALLESLGNHDTRIGMVLKRLCITSSTFGRQQLEHVLGVLASNHQLEFLRLGEVYEDDEVGAGNELLESSVDTVIVPIQSKRALRTFLLAASQHHVLRSLPQCTRLIAEFAITRVRRHISWEELA